MAMAIPPFVRKRWALLAILLAGAVVGLLRLAGSPPSAEDDQTNTWWPVSTSVANGEGFVECLPIYFPFCGPGNEATAMREPLPVFLFAGVVALHGSLWEAGLLQWAMQLLVILVIYRFTKELAGQRAGLIAAGLWVLYLPGWLVLPQIAGDVVATLMVTTGLWCYARAWRSGRPLHWALAGACLGLAVLSRSALLVLSLPLGLGVLGLAWRSGARNLALVRPLAIFALAWALVMLPWAIRNRMVFDQVVIGSTLTGYNVLRHNHQVAGGGPFHFVNEDEGRPLVLAALARHPELTGQENEAQVDRVYKAEGMAIVQANKARYVALSAYRFLPLWFNWGVYRAYGKALGPFDHGMALEQAALLLLGLAGAWKAPRRSWPMALGVVMFSLAYMAIVARLRYLLPVMPVVVFFAAIALARLRGPFRPAKAA